MAGSKSGVEFALIVSLMDDVSHSQSVSCSQQSYHNKTGRSCGRQRHLLSLAAYYRLVLHRPAARHPLIPSPIYTALHNSTTSSVTMSSEAVVSEPAVTESATKVSAVSVCCCRGAHCPAAGPTSRCPAAAFSTLKSPVTRFSAAVRPPDPLLARVPLCLACLIGKRAVNVIMAAEITGQGICACHSGGGSLTPYSLTPAARKLRTAF